MRGVRAPNRLWLAPMCQYSVTDHDGVPTDWHLVHLGARAVGGFGLLLAEATAVHPEGRISLWDTGLWNERQRDAWARVVELAHAQGALIGIQLSHAGRKASMRRPFDGEPRGPLTAGEGAWATVGPSAIASAGSPPASALAIGQIHQIVADFAAAAQRADEAGFDVVELHGAHGYLAHQFLSPLTNLRTDRYGGDAEGRSRFLREVVTAVRTVWPEHKPLFVRLSATEWLDGGWGVTDAVELIRGLTSLGVDLIDVSSGGNVPAPVPVGRGYHVPLSAQIRAEAQVATAAVGLIVDPRQAERVLTSGAADAVLLGRAALREPAWPLRAAFELGVEWERARYPAPYTRGTWDAAAPYLDRRP